MDCNKIVLFIWFSCIVVWQVILFFLRFRVVFLVIVIQQKKLDKCQHLNVIVGKAIQLKDQKDGKLYLFKKIE